MVRFPSAVDTVENARQEASNAEDVSMPRLLNAFGFAQTSAEHDDSLSAAFQHGSSSALIRQAHPHSPGTSARPPHLSVESRSCCWGSSSSYTPRVGSTASHRSPSSHHGASHPHCTGTEVDGAQLRPGLKRGPTSRRHLHHHHHRDGSVSTRLVERSQRWGDALCSPKSMRSGARKWRWVALRLKLGGVDALTQLLARIQPTELQLPSHPEAVTQVAALEDLKAVPYWKQGDSDMYSLEVLQVRNELRHHHLIAVELGVWWATAMRCVAPGERTVALLSKEHYCEILCRISKAFLRTFEPTEVRLHARHSHVRPTRVAAPYTRYIFH